MSIATNATVTAALFLELDRLSVAVESTRYHTDIDPRPARKLLTAASLALYLCPSELCDAWLPLETRTIPWHEDLRGRQCTRAGAFLPKDTVQALRGHRLPA